MKNKPVGFKTEEEFKAHLRKLMGRPRKSRRQERMEKKPFTREDIISMLRCTCFGCDV